MIYFVFGCYSITKKQEQLNKKFPKLVKFDADGIPSIAIERRFNVGTNI